MSFFVNFYLYFDFPEILVDERKEKWKKVCLVGYIDFSFDFQISYILKWVVAEFTYLRELPKELSELENMVKLLVMVIYNSGKHNFLTAIEAILL